MHVYFIKPVLKEKKHSRSTICFCEGRKKKVIICSKGVPAGAFGKIMSNILENLFIVNSLFSNRKLKILIEYPVFKLNNCIFHSQYLYWFMFKKKICDLLKHKYFNKIFKMWNKKLISTCSIIFNNNF